MAVTLTEPFKSIASVSPNVSLIPPSTAERPATSPIPNKNPITIVSCTAEPEMVAKSSPGLQL